MYGAPPPSAFLKQNYSERNNFAFLRRAGQIIPFEIIWRPNSFAGSNPFYLTHPPAPPHFWDENTLPAYTRLKTNLNRNILTDYTIILG